MAECRTFENDKVNQLVLKYADHKYKFALMHKQDSNRCPDTIWTLHESLDDALSQQDAETKAYDNDEEFQFYICEVVRKEHVLTSVLSGKQYKKTHETVDLVPVSKSNR